MQCTFYFPTRRPNDRSTWNLHQQFLRYQRTDNGWCDVITRLNLNQPITIAGFFAEPLPQTAVARQPPAVRQKRQQRTG